MPYNKPPQNLVAYISKHWFLSLLSLQISRGTSGSDYGLCGLESRLWVKLENNPRVSLSIAGWRGQWLPGTCYSHGIHRRAWGSQNCSSTCLCHICSILLSKQVMGPRPSQRAGNYITTLPHSEEVMGMNICWIIILIHLVPSHTVLLWIQKLLLISCAFFQENSVQIQVY